MTAIIILSPLLATLSAFADTATPPIPVSLTNRNAWSLGTGYDSRSQVIKGYCVDNAPDKGNPPDPAVEVITGNLDLKLEKDEHAVADKLGISGSGRYQAGVMSTSLSADFMNEASSNDFRISYTYVKEDLFRETMVSSRQYPIRALPDRTGSLKTPMKWFEACGDEYVQSRIKGARLFINVNISFVSKKERDSFKSKFDLETNVVKITADLSKDHSEFSSGNRMTIQAIQVGGDTSQLGTMLCPSTGADGKLDPDCASGSRAVVNCGFGNLNDCASMIANAMAYGNGKYAGAYPDQIKNRNNFVVTALETVPYSSVGGAFPPALRDDQLTIERDARKRATDLFNEVHPFYVFADQLWTSHAPRLSAGERDRMETFRTRLADELETVSEMIDTCYDKSVPECNDAYSKVLHDTAKDAEGNTVPKTDFGTVGWKEKYNKFIQDQTEPDSFAQYCDYADSDHPAIQRTIQTLWDYAQSKLPPTDFDNLDKKGDRCLNLAQWLDKQTEITIPPSIDPLNPTIGDLRPFTTLPNLEVLSLEKQSIQDASPFAKLKNLRVLDLDDNQLTDVKPLAALKQLQTLSVQNNRITDLSPLAALDRKTGGKTDGDEGGKLHLLNASGNGDGLQCPLANPTSCRTMSFAHYADISSANTRCDEVIGAAAVPYGDGQHIVTTGGRETINISNRIQLVSNQGCQTMPKPLAIPRKGHTMTVTPQGILVIGGGTNRIERLDPKTLVPTMLPGTLAENVTNHTATKLDDGRVLVVGGATDADVNTALYNPRGLSSLVQLVNSDGSVTKLGNLSVPRAEHTATLLKDGTVLIVGGYSLSGMIQTVERIDPAHGTIMKLPEVLPVGRSGQGAALLANGHVLFVGGTVWDQITAKDGRVMKVTKPIDQLLDFDPVSNKFRVIEEKLKMAVSNPQVVLTSDNRVLLFGGSTAASTTADEKNFVWQSTDLIQVYDPTTEALYKVSSMLYRRFGFTATALDSQTVLVYGGSVSYTYDKGQDKLDPNNKDTIKDPSKQDPGKQDPTKSVVATSTELLIYRPHP